MYAGSHQYLVGLRNGAVVCEFGFDDQDRALMSLARAVDDEQVYVTGRMGVYASMRRLANGLGPTSSIDRQHSYPRPLPSVADGTVVVTTTHSIVSFDVADGTERWSIDSPGRIAGRIATADGRLYVACWSGSVVVFGEQPVDE